MVGNCMKEGRNRFCYEDGSMFTSTSDGLGSTTITLEVSGACVYKDEPITPRPNIKKCVELNPSFFN